MGPRPHKYSKIICFALNRGAQEVAPYRVTRSLPVKFDLSSRLRMTTAHAPAVRRPRRPAAGGIYKGAKPPSYTFSLVRFFGVSQRNEQ